MFGLLAYAWSSALVAAMLGTLPGRSFAFRVGIVALFLTAFPVVAFAVARLWVSQLFNQSRLPDGVNAGEWATLGVFVPSLVEIAGFLLMVLAAYLVRSKLLPRDEPDKRVRKLLVLAGAVLVVLVVTVPWSLGGGLLRMGELTLKVFF